MAKPATVATMTSEEQREATLQSSPMSQAVTSVSVTVRDPKTGKTASVGQIDLGRAPRGVPSDPAFENLRAGMENRLHRTGVQAATILNMLPIPLMVNSPMGSIANVIIPACNEGQAFTYHTWTQVFIDNLLSSEGIKTPWDVHPIQMADAFVEEYRSFGGVVEILGSLDGYDPMADPLIRPSIDAARERMYAWAQGVVRDAESLWNSQGGAQKNAIVDHHRACAQILFDTGRLGKLPEWMRLEPSAHELAKPCPVCRVTPKKGAALCVSQGCNYVLDPAAAFHLGMIDETSPVLERLTRLEVEELGISGFVAETADEKPARLKLGVPKPLSAFERSSLDAKK